MSKTPDELREELLKLAPIDYDEWFKSADSTDVQNAIDYLGGLAQWAVRLSEYLERRFMGASHVGAVDAQNKVAAKVRKAMGYTYYKQDFTF